MSAGNAKYEIVLNAAEATVDLVLAQGSGIVYSRSWDTPTQATEILPPALQDMLRQHTITLNDIMRIACVAGPGSFTGIRLTLTIAAAWRRIVNIPVAGINYLQSLATRAQRVHTIRSGHIWVLTHARRNLVHLQSFAPRPDTPPSPATSVVLCTPAQALEYIRQCPSDDVMLGSGIARNPECAAAGVARVLPYTNPEAQDLWTIAQHTTYQHQDIEPQYVRPCDAVENLDHIARKQGMEPGMAHARLQWLLSTPAGETT